jgi:hypothetical protein
MLSSYRDLTVLVGAPTGDGYPVTLRGDGCDARGLLLPSHDPTFADLIAQLARLDLSEVETDTLGQILFRALFDGPLKSVFDRSIGALGTGQRFRLRLDIDPREAIIAALPWEYLHDPDRGPLALRDTPLVRYLPTQAVVPTLYPRSRARIGPEWRY